MKKLAILLFIPFNAFLQNLVPNPSFEYDTACPWQGGEMAYAPPWKSVCSSDLFDTCDWSFQPIVIPGYNLSTARTGISVAGLYVMDYFLTSPIPAGSEYIQVPLLTNLQMNEFYEVKFYTKLNSNFSYATNNLGGYFSEIAIDTSNNIPWLDYDAHILKSGNPIISDSLNWVEVSEIYRAGGNEAYLTIGNFESYVNTDTLAIKSYGSISAYYFIDDVSVTLIDTLDCSLLANAGADTLINPGGKAFIGSEIANLPCTWYLLDGTLIANDKSNLTVSPSQTTTYVVEQNLCGNISYDTVTVFVGYVGLEESSPLIPLPSADGGKVVPNPNNGTFTIELNNGIELQELKLLDELGRTVKVLDPKSKNFELNLPEGVSLSLPKGLYFLEFTSDKQRFLEKLLVN